MSKAHPGAIVFHTGDPDGDIKSQDTKALHTYGILFQTNWITIHDTDVQGNIPFSANALAKASSGTPFKRPENGQFRPGSHFQEFFFDETGDTNALTEAGADFGGFGAIQKLTLKSNSNEGTLTLFYKGDVQHSGFDNVAFWSKDEILFVEDAGRWPPCSTQCTRTPRSCLTWVLIMETRARRRRCESWRKGETLQRLSTPPSAQYREVGFKMRVTTRSQAGIYRMAIPRQKVCWAPRILIRSRPAGDCSTRASTVTSSPGRLPQLASKATNRASITESRKTKPT